MAGGSGRKRPNAGGSVRPEDFIPFSLPSIGEEEIAEVVDALRSGWITTGPKTMRFERQFADYAGCRHAISVNSCTAALHLALDAVGLEEGDEVVTSPMTFAATAEVVRYFRARPSFVDIDPVTMNIDPSKLEEYIGSRSGGGPVKAILPVHFAGQPCDMDRILETARLHGLRVIEDAAHALPAFYKGKMAGTLGDIGCFSFYATKNITTGEGGMLVTENDEWAERARLMRLHGISTDAWKRYSAEGHWYYEITAPGYKYNLTDVASALGIVQLGKAEAFWKRRRKIARNYNEAFGGIEEVETPPGGDNGHSWHLYVLRLNLARLGIDRDQFVAELKRRGIGTSVHFIPLHMHPYYRETYGYRPEDFPAAFESYKRAVSLPIYPKMTDGDVQRVIREVRDVITRNRKMAVRPEVRART
jgi:perosamine synthetase